MPEKRWLTISSSIKGAIRRGELHSGARIASESEMAAQWNVSPMTVHRALTELQREGWVIRRPKFGTVVADRSVQPATKIALTYSSHSHTPQGAYAAGIEEGLADSGQLLPLSTHNSAVEEAKCLERAAAECSGIICYPTGAQENTALLKRVAASKPLVFIDCIPEGINADVVMTDNFGSMLMGLQHLDALGHARIAYFMESPHLVSSVRERYGAYKEFMKREKGVTDPDRWVRQFPGIMERDQYFARVEAVLIELLSEPEPVTAVVCQQDATMAAVLEAVVRLGLSVPDDLTVLSFSDVPPRVQPLARSVHRLVQRPEEIGNMAAKRILFRLNHPEVKPQATRLMADLYPATGYPLSDAARKFRAERGESHNR